MTLYKRILSSPWVQKTVAFLASLYIRVVFHTTRWQFVGEDKVISLLGSPFIICFWHNRLCMMSCAWRFKLPVHMMISKHRDGRLISDTVRFLGIKTIQGSTGKGGKEALQLALRSLRKHPLGITPDGPRGPKEKVSSGLAVMARRARVKTIPVTYHIQRGKTLRSWDSLFIPYPFSRGIIVWGNPIDCPSSKEESNVFSQKVEQGLADVTRIAHASV